MTFAVGFFGMIAICVIATMAFLIVAAWREDRENRRERLSGPQHNESAADQRMSLAPEWDPLANLIEKRRH